MEIKTDHSYEGKRICPFCSTESNKVSFSSREERWEHFAKSHPDFVNQFMESLLQDLNDPKIVSHVEGMGEIWEAVKYINKNYSNEFTKAQEVLNIVNKYFPEIDSQ